MCLALPAIAADPTTIRIDLADLPAGHTTIRPGGPGMYKFTLVNVVPRFKPYAVDVSRDYVTQTPLSNFPGATPPTAGKGSAPAILETDCGIADLTNKLNGATTESEVKNTIDTAVKNATSDCLDRIKSVIQSLSEQNVDGVFAVGPAETINVKASRAGGTTWTYSLEGKARGEWRTTYGFFFVPNRDERYFTKETHPTDNTSKFTITRQANREQFDFVPTVLFTFIPYSQLGKTMSHGFAAGLGYDLEKPVVVAGYAGTYNENITLTAGIAFHRRSRLLGRYNVGEETKEALESAQLVEDTYGPNVYVGVGFRFGEDIHARRRELEKATAKAEADAAEANARAAKAEQKSAAVVAKCKEDSQKVLDEAVKKCQDEACNKKEQEAFEKRNQACSGGT